MSRFRALRKAVVSAIIPLLFLPRTDGLAMQSTGGTNSPGLDDPQALRRLDSWKEIAAYLKRDERTVRRWEESEGLPVHRHLHHKRGTVYAYAGELDRWWTNPHPRLETEQLLGEGQPGHRLWLAAATAFAVVTMAFGFYLFRGHIWSRAKPPAGRIMLAVLPFQNLSGDAQEEYLSDGLTEEMITQLGQFEPQRLGIIARTSAMHYKHTDKPADQIGRELRVDYVLEGSVRRSGDHVRVTAQLIQVQDQTHIWAETYDRDLREFLALQRDVAGAIAEKIEIKLTPSQHLRFSSVRSVNPEAYELYLKGRYFWNKRDAEGLKKALDYFQGAAEKDPSYAPAQAGLADTYSLLGAAGYDVLRTVEAMEKARAAANRALLMDEELAEAHASLGFVNYSYDWDWSNAEKEFRRAIALNQNYATAHQWYSEYLSDLGRPEEAFAEARAALALDPRSLIVNENLARPYYFARRFDQAIESSRKTLEMDPNFPIAHLRLGRAYAAKSAYREAVEEFQRFSTLSGNTPLAAASIGNVLARSGDRAGAIRTLDELTKISKQKRVPPICFALVYVGLSNNDRALHWLERAYEERSDFLPVLKVDPLFDPLRLDPHFQDLLHRMGLL